MVKSGPVNGADTTQTARPNRLLRWLLALSFIVHLFVLGYVSGIYRAHQLSFIELSMRSIAKPFTRTIPRPRYRPKKHPKPRQIQDRKIVKPMPRFKPLKLEPLDTDAPDSIVESLSVPVIPEVSGDNFSDTQASAVEYTTMQDYFEMVKDAIERHKKYPYQAKSRQVEGRVLLQFVITSLGSVRNIEIIKTSRHQVLDDAALKAVRTAAPFPAPPRGLFKGDVPLQISIVFELTPL